MRHDPTPYLSASGWRTRAKLDCGGQSECAAPLVGGAEAGRGMSESKDVKYEDALKRLEKLVAELDKSELDLEARLKKFEEGTKLARLLLKKLDQAKKKVQLLVKTNVGETELVPFEGETGGDERDDDAEAV